MEERQAGKESQSKSTEPMETGHNPRITPGTHSLLGGRRVFRKIAHRLYYSTVCVYEVRKIYQD